MRAFLVGHRGTGKSHFLRALWRAAPEVNCVDLDRYIEEKENRKIQDIFQRDGENFFRALEQKHLECLLREYPEPQSLVVALGAGCDLSLLPNHQIFWIGRRSDSASRIFFDRPLLSTPPIHPRLALDDYLSRYPERNERYESAAAGRVIWMPEGRPGQIEIDLFRGQMNLSGASLTLTPAMAKMVESERKNYIATLQRAGLRYLEIRNDLLSFETARAWLPLIPREMRLVSLRTPRELGDFLGLEALRDWDQELWEKAGRSELIDILSSHDHRAPRPPGSRAPGLHLKWSPQISDHSRLEAALDWQASDPIHRSFLPRSPNEALEASYIWLRLWLKERQRLNFVKLRTHSASEEAILKNGDQPCVFEWMSWSPQSPHFAAVLGDPALHSWSPSVHRDFFRARNMNMVAIPTKSGSLESSLKLLGKLGLRAAALTSPLKNEVFEMADERHASSHPFEAANTLIIDRRGRRHVWNTDGLGAEFLARGLEQHDAAVIGGGGVQRIFRQLYPRAAFYSARTLELRSGVERGNYPLVFWAAGGRVQDLRDDFLPPSCHSPRIFVDLDYRENSTGRAVAWHLKHCRGLSHLKYIAGHKMFFKQAKTQQEIWSEALE